MDGGTWEVEWADSLRKSDAGLWEACPAAVTLVGVQSLIWSWALCYLNLKDSFEAWALSFWHITWVIPVRGKKGWWCSCFFLILISSRGANLWFVFSTRAQLHLLSRACLAQPTELLLTLDVSPESGGRENVNFSSQRCVFFHGKPVLFELSG